MIESCATESASHGTTGLATRSPSSASSSLSAACIRHSRKLRILRLSTTQQSSAKLAEPSSTRSAKSTSASKRGSARHAIPRITSPSSTLITSVRLSSPLSSCLTSPQSSTSCLRKQASPLLRSQFSSLWLTHQLMPMS